MSARALRETGRRVNGVAGSRPGKAVTDISRMIKARHYFRDKREEKWKEKLAVKGYVTIRRAVVELP